MSEKMKILIVDDEDIIRSSLSNWLKEDGHYTEAVESGAAALERVKSKEWNLLLVDLKMPGMDGLEVMNEVKKTHPELPIIIITAYATVDTAVKAMKDGAYDYLIKPFNPEEISLIIRKLMEHQRLINENIYLLKELKEQHKLQDLVSNSNKMQEIFELVRTVAKSNSTVLIQGESGTGKEILARAIHDESLRRDKPFISISCAALTETLLESELFGHEKGSFTGAAYQKKGKFEIAEGGTLFLDEIGDVSSKLQMDLLRVLEQREFHRVGGTEPVKVDVRVIAATNKDLKRAMEEGKFREDLYYRLNVISISIPPLRERKEDIPLLAAHFLNKFNMEMSKNILKISDEAMEILKNYDWPGNIREVKNCIERAVVLTKGNVITPKDLAIHVSDAKGGHGLLQDTDTLDSVEREHLLEVLKKNNWNIQKSASILGIDRGTLYNKIKKYGLEREGDR